MASISTNFDPLRNADQLGTALQQGLPRPMNPRLSWSLIRTLILGGLTGGIAPVLALPGRFKKFVESEQMQYWHLAEWMRLRGAPESGAATRMANEMVPAFWLPLFAKLFAVVAIGIGISAVRAERTPRMSAWNAWTHLIWANAPVRSHHRDHERERIIPDLFGVQAGDGKQYEASATVGSSTVPTPNDLILPFNLAITGACLCWLMQINGHVSRAKNFVTAFNRVTERFGVGPVRAPGWNIGLRPAWLASGIVLATMGAYWAVPVMMAAAAQRSYIIRSTRTLRSDLARRQRDVLLCQRPPIHVPASSYLLANCPQPNCRAPLPPEAGYCRRCGTKLESSAAKNVAGNRPNSRMV